MAWALLLTAPVCFVAACRAAMSLSVPEKCCGSVHMHMRVHASTSPAYVSTLLMRVLPCLVPGIPQHVRLSCKPSVLLSIKLQARQDYMHNGVH